MDKKPYSSRAKRSKSSAVGAVQHGKATPKCQVDGCDADLADTKGFYCRHKVCPTHSKCAAVLVAGVEMRFCQQCSRFHQLAEFDKEKRSCRRKLAAHNQRRRKMQPGEAMVSSIFGALCPPHFGQHGGSSFMMDFGAYATSQEDNAQQPKDLFPWQNSPQAHKNSSSQFNFPEECRPAGACSLLSDHQQQWQPTISLSPSQPQTELDHFNIFSPWISYTPPSSSNHGEGSSLLELLQPDLGLGLPQHPVDNTSDYFGALGLGLPNDDHSHRHDHAHSSTSVHHFQHWPPK